jgi:hypothetical protein
LLRQVHKLLRSTSFLGSSLKARLSNSKGIRYNINKIQNQG